MNKIGAEQRAFRISQPDPGPEICRKFSAARLKINTLLKFSCKSR